MNYEHLTLEVEDPMKRGQSCAVADSGARVLAQFPGIWDGCPGFSRAQKVSPVTFFFVVLEWFCQFSRSMVGRVPPGFHQGSTGNVWSNYKNIGGRAKPWIAKMDRARNLVHKKKFNHHALQLVWRRSRFGFQIFPFFWWFLSGSLGGDRRQCIQYVNDVNMASSSSGFFLYFAKNPLEDRMVGPESAEIEDLKALRRPYPNIMLHACLEFCSSQSIPLKDHSPRQRQLLATSWSRRCGSWRWMAALAIRN